MSKIPPPPVPQKLREMFKDCPEYIERLQEVLNEAIEKRLYGTPMLEQAIWALEGRLETFMSEASAALQVAESSCDAQAIARAELNERLMFRAGSSNGGMRDLHELKLYFDVNKEAFE